MIMIMSCLSSFCSSCKFMIIFILTSILLIITAINNYKQAIPISIENTIIAMCVLGMISILSIIGYFRMKYIEIRRMTARDVFAYT